MVHLTFAYPHVFYILIPLWIALNIYRYMYHKTPRYMYPLTNQIKKHTTYKKNYHTIVLSTLRSLFLLMMICLIARPQWVDARSRVNIDGVDIILTLDASLSMQCFDDTRDRRTRIDVAKVEAMRFVDRRLDDPIGVVIFGAQAIARCPLTLDKNILKHIIHDIKLGMINPSGTSLGTGIATAVTKLKTSKAKNKIIILLTDGKPTPQTEQISVEAAIKLAKEHSIKIYAIAIGNKEGGYLQSSFGFIEKIQDSIDEELLQNIAKETNGKFFRANNPKEMAAIYDTIDKLEKTTYNTNIFSRYYEAFASFFWGPLSLLTLEYIIRLFLFKGLL